MLPRFGRGVWWVPACLTIGAVLAFAIAATWPGGTADAGLDDGVFLPQENFDTNTLPAGWSTRSSAAAQGWGWAFVGRQARIAVGDAAVGVVDAEIQLPPIDLTGVVTAQLGIRSWAQYHSESATVDVSVDGGTTWSTVWNQPYTPLRAQHRIDLSSVVGRSDVRIRFRAKLQKIYTSAPFWELDDVWVKASPRPPVGLAAKPLTGTRSIQLAWTLRAVSPHVSQIVERWADEVSGWRPLARLAGDAAGYVDHSAECGFRYFYRVRADNGHVQSPAIAPVNAVAQACSGQALIEINQVLGRQSNRYVAGKETAVLLYLPTPANVDPARQRATISRDGVTVATLVPQPAAGLTDALIFTCRTLAECDNWRAGTYRFDVTVGETTYTIPEVLFQERRPLRILAVPVKAKYRGVVKTASPDAVKTAGELAARIFPLGANGLAWQVGPEVDLSDQLNVFTDNKTVWNVAYQIFSAVGRQPASCYTDRATCVNGFVGYLPEEITDRFGGGLLAGAATRDVAMVATGQRGIKSVTAHEMGHFWMFDLGDEYSTPSAIFYCDVNPPPPTLTGLDGRSCPNSTERPYPKDPLSGSLIDPARDHPLEIGGRGRILTDLVSFMGNYNDDSVSWVTAAGWRGMFDKLGPPVTPPARSSLRAAAIDPFRIVEVSGTIDPTGNVTVNPWRSFTTTLETEPISSTYRIQAIDTQGTPLAAQGIEVEFSSPEVPFIDLAPFSAVVDYPTGTVAFQILSDTRVLKEIPVSRHAPTVAVTAPAAGELATGVRPIRWTAADADGDPLTYQVEYNASDDPAGWIVLASGIMATEWLQNFDVLPGGTGASRIQVTATDGVNATSATGPLFSVPARAPDAFITNPAPGTRIRQDLALTLSGFGVDLKDGRIATSTGLVWTSDRLTGTIGTGPTVNVTGLLPGEHRITLAVTNSVGVTAVATTTVVVEAQPSFVYYLPIAPLKGSYGW